MRDSLAKLQPATPMNKEELNAKKREAYEVHDILVVTPEQRAKLPNKIVEAIVQAGNILYGGKR